MHFFLGDGLVLLQLIRLARPLTKREKLTSVVIACFHFGVLCTLAPNIRFVALFMSAIFLFPGALKEVFTEPETLLERSHDGLLPEIRLVPTFRVALWLSLGSAFVFITFPRFTGTRFQFRESMNDQGSLLDSLLDPRKGGRANSQQVLLQVEGSSVGYLRCFALSESDGVRWWADKSATLWFNRYESAETVRSSSRYLPRKVFVKNAQYLGHIVPVDGAPVYMEQNFFTRPRRNTVSDALECSGMWTTGNNVYTYYVDKEAPPPQLLPNLRKRLLYHPPQSARLTQWLQETTSKGTNVLNKSRILELHLRNQFKYQLGTPELDRLAPVDDFIFNRQEGHCERFAAAMALFLRMEGIPSRVVVGYVAATRNVFSGRLQARFCDAHSWAEGYFDGIGWVSFDATPGPPPGGEGSSFWDMLEDLDFAWYSYVVNFNGFAQKDLGKHTASLLGSVPRSTWNSLASMSLALLVASLVVRLFPGQGWKFRLPGLRRSAGQPGAAARHSYDEMLQSFARTGLVKAPEQTPIEFLNGLRSTYPAAYNEAALVTQSFCDSFYGARALSRDQQAATDEALARLRSALKQTGKHGAHEQSAQSERS
jgi:transglutaminase-like putative cysteine protease